MESPPDDKTPCANESLSLAAHSALNNESSDSKSPTAMQADAMSPSGRNATRQFQKESFIDGHKRPRIVSGFGRERVDDVAAHEERLSKEMSQRARHRYEEGKRGRMRDWHDNDLDRSEGGAWHSGKR